MITKSKLRLFLCIGALVLMLGVIWGNSMTPGNISGQMSGWVSQLIGKILPFLSPESEHGHLLVRKIAHFSEFALLGLLLRWLFAMLCGPKLLRFAFSLGSGMLAAVIDECIQLFSPGRVCSFWDMCIDWSGVLAGIFVFILARLLYLRIKKTDK